MEFQFQVVFCIITNAGGEGVPSCIILILFCIERERMFLVTDICGNRCTDHASKTIKETLLNNIESSPLHDRAKMLNVFNKRCFVALP